jgi:hypothetical protein
MAPITPGMHRDAMKDHMNKYSESKNAVIEELQRARKLE